MAGKPSKPESPLVSKARSDADFYAVVADATEKLEAAREDYRAHRDDEPTRDRWEAAKVEFQTVRQGLRSLDPARSAPAGDGSVTVAAPVATASGEDA